MEIKKNKFYVVNPAESDICLSRFVLCFGAYGSTKMLVWGYCLQSALDKCIDYLRDRLDGKHLITEQVNDEYTELLDQGKTESEAYEQATIDITCGGNYGDYIASWEWGLMAENPDRQELKRIIKNC